ncbi:glucans biosynthesis glucosyltransferase MdoH [Luteolibacter algae]|uniref:Glucans biosynthesis glucosyltransferase H n=1 Tax=Luteolibacter algae TaxID=454151 RepID=A0ABW5DCC3_9BACT
MDTQPIDPRFSGKPFYGKGRAKLRRFVFFTGVLLVNLAAVLWMADLFFRSGFHRAHVLLLIIFAILNGLLVLGSFHALFGALDIITGRKRSVRISRLAEGAPDHLEKRYAVVMPVYNEDSAKFCARIEAIYRSIETTGQLDKFDFFLLSDTRDLDLWVLEEVAWTNLCRRLKGFGKIYYRRRKVNENRKAGNIGDFVRTWGGGYEGMLVLDADSLMDGSDIVKMAKVMEAYPRLGILQTPPKLIRGVSVFTRLQQFAMRLYGPLFIRGLNFWQLGGGSYWGHNAMIRVKPFSEFCELPALPGREPFGGRILSHDFVEAALMVSEGWEVWLAWDIEGTYEEAPPTLVDHLKRDRRWCQGNLQHFWLIFARKLPLTVRIHLFMGIMAYLGSPLWFLFLIFGTWVAWDFHVSDLTPLPFDSFAERTFGIAGQWQGMILIGFVFTLLFLPKILALAGAMLVPRLRRAFGGFFPLLVGGMMETIVSMLLAPCMMLAHTLMVLSIITGHAVGWGNQSRETDGTAWADALRFHLAPTLLGIAWTVLALQIGWVFTLWMSPILLGLILCIPVSVWTSRSKYGRALARKNILATPEETSPPEILNLAIQAEASVHVALNAQMPHREGVIAAVVDPYVNSVHISLLENSDMGGVDESLANRCLKNGPGALSKSDLSQLLYTMPAMLMMHRAVWLGAMEDLHPIWIKAVESYRMRPGE